MSAIPGLPPLVLGANRQGWHSRGEGDTKSRQYLAIARQALVRDDFRCGYCGFQSVPDGNISLQQDTNVNNERALGYMKICPADGKPDILNVENVRTVCPFCFEVLNCGAGMGESTGLIILCPWFSQEDLCLMLNGMAVACAQGDAESVIVKQLWAYLESLQFAASAYLGQQRMDGGILAAGLLTLSEISPQLYLQREKVVGKLRFMPYMDFFCNAVDYWKKSVWRPLKQWEEIYLHWLKLQNNRIS